MLDLILRRTQNADGIIIVGAGKRGRELLESFKEYDSIFIKAFFDNNNALIGTYIDGIEIMKPHKAAERNILYVISVNAVEIQEKLYAQLQDIGIGAYDIVIYYSKRNYDYLSKLDERFYEEEIRNMYYEKLGKELNWKNPSTYNEIINWEKVNIKDERRTRLADKYLVRDWIKEQIGEEYLTKLYGVWDDAEDIDFENLPNAFVLKVNNGSGRNIIVKDKGRIYRAQVCKQLNEWKKNNFAYNSLELHYKNIVPKIMCEEYLEGVAENVYDYNIYCFHGEPLYIWCIKGSHRPGCQASFYTPEWELQPFSYGYPKDNVVAPKPEKLEEMLELSRLLSKDFEHVRVDWYNLPGGRLLFGEMTFSTWGGLAKWEPEEYDAVFGNLIKT